MGRPLDLDGREREQLYCRSTLGAGDSAAWLAFRRDLKRRLRAFRPPPGETIDDVVADTGSKVWEHLSRIRSDGGLLPYAFTVGVKLIQRGWRRHQSRRGEPLHSEPAGPDLTLGNMEASELFDRLQSVLNRKEKQLFRAVFARGVRGAEVWRALDVEAPIAWLRSSRVRKKLRDALLRCSTEHEPVETMLAAADYRHFR
jgi:DNA-directed RNA polymerase specialized sigma24 family protein